MIIMQMQQVSVEMVWDKKRLGAEGDPLGTVQEM